MIEILILTLRNSYIFQPLNVAVSQPLKKAPTKEPDAFIPLNSGRLMCVELTSMYHRASTKIFRTANIKSGWKATDLHPRSPIEMLDKLATPPPI